jgi:hypothetical protein
VLEKNWNTSRQKGSKTSLEEFSLVKPGATGFKIIIAINYNSLSGIRTHVSILQ